jgi:hypothetical protein
VLQRPKPIKPAANATGPVVPETIQGRAWIVRWSVRMASLIVAFVVTLPVNRALIARGKGHAVGSCLSPLTQGSSRGVAFNPTDRLAFSLGDSLRDVCREGSASPPWNRLAWSFGSMVGKRQ